ncbi:MAG: hypothetical protein ACPG5T_07095, partial [Endozoicomonas sp.]
AENVCIRIRWGDAEGLFLEPVSFKPPSDTAAVKPEGSKWSLFTSLVYGVQYTGGNLFELGMHGIKVVKYGKAIYAIYDQKALLTYQGFFSIGVFIWNFVEIYKHSIHAMNYQTDHEFSEAELVIVSTSSAFEFYYESPEIMDTLYNVLGYSGKGIKVSDWLNIISYSLIFRNLYETISGISASSINWWATWIGQDSGEIEPESFPP